MKIAYISSTYFADVDFCLLKHLSKKVDVTYILLYYKNGNATVCNFKKTYAKTGLFRADIYPELGIYSEFINLNKTYVLNINSEKSYSLSFFLAYLKLFIFLITRDFDLIHITKPFDIYAYFLYFLRKRIVFSIHDPIDHSSSNNMRYLFNKFISVKLLKNYILYNRKQVDEFFDFFKICKTKKKFLVSNLSCYDCLKVKEPLVMKLPKRYVLFFGTINTYKGLEFLLPAIKQIHKKDPSVSFIIAGKGNYYFDISEYSCLDYIDFRNRFIPDNELVGLIKNSQFCILPYVDATQSGVVMSAFAFNKPCVVTNVGGLPEMVKPNKYGIVIPPKNIRAIVDSTIYLLSNKDILKEMCQNIENDYHVGNMSWIKVAEDTFEFYKTI